MIKSKDLYDELAAIAKSGGITIRKESGNFKSGYCLVDDKPIIILNKFNSIDYLNKIIALGISYFKMDNQFIKPNIREYIDKEALGNKLNLFEINIDNTELNGKEKK